MGHALKSSFALSMANPFAHLRKAMGGLGESWVNAAGLCSGGIAVFHSQGGTYRALFWYASGILDARLRTSSTVPSESL